MLYIGDVHGKYAQYKRILKGSTGPTVQVGDMGVGFRRSRGWREGEYSANPPYLRMKAGGHRFIRGNHDNPSVCRVHSQCIADGTVDGDQMYIGGAVSIDRASRTEGYDWWREEELSTPELNQLVDVYQQTKPRVMVTHDCPESLAVEMARLSSGVLKLDPHHSSRSRQAFESMWQSHSPELWVFGHWHHSFDAVLNGTRFVCLAELEARDL